MTDHETRWVVFDSMERGQEGLCGIYATYQEARHAACEAQRELADGEDDLKTDEEMAPEKDYDIVELVVGGCFQNGGEEAWRLMTGKA